MPTDNSVEITMTLLESLEWGKIIPIIQETSTMIRKGDVVKESQSDSLRVITVDAMPSDKEVPSNLHRHDCIFFTAAIDAEKAKANRANLIKLLEPAKQAWLNGPSYIHIGGVLGDQGLAILLMALGQEMGIWSLLTPYTLMPNIEESKAMALAGNGLLMCQGWKV